MQSDRLQGTTHQSTAACMLSAEQPLAPCDACMVWCGVILKTAERKLMQNSLSFSETLRKSNLGHCTAALQHYQDAAYKHYHDMTA
jgi:hypothetical protein